VAAHSVRDACEACFEAPSVFSRAVGGLLGVPLQGLADEIVQTSMVVTRWTLPDNTERAHAHKENANYILPTQRSPLRQGTFRR
jgi:hypothetical protein